MPLYNFKINLIHINKRTRRSRGKIFTAKASGKASMFETMEHLFDIYARTTLKLTLAERREYENLENIHRKEVFYHCMGIETINYVEVR